MKKSLFNSIIILASLFISTSIRSQVVVAPGATCQLHDWVTRVLGTTAEIAFEPGPSNPPMGGGSVRLSIGPVSGLSEIRTPAYDNTLLSQITELKYWTYVQQDLTAQCAPTMFLNVDLDNNGTIDEQLRFEPFEQDGDLDGHLIPVQGPLMRGVWQEWNALAGGWQIANIPTGDQYVSTFQNYISLHPGARLLNDPNTLGSVRVITLPGWTNFTGYTDKFTIGINGSSQTFDFEVCDDDDGDGVTNFYDCDYLSAKNNKWLVCHNGHTICVEYSAIPAHFNHGDDLGPCLIIGRNTSASIHSFSPQFKISIAPNPVITTANMKYELPVDAKISIVLFDPQGKAVKTLVNADRKAGVYNYQLDASKLPAGIYYYRMTAIAGDQQFVQGQKLMIVK